MRLTVHPSRLRLREQPAVEAPVLREFGMAGQGQASAVQHPDRLALKRAMTSPRRGSSVNRGRE